MDFLNKLFFYRCNFPRSFFKGLFFPKGREICACVSRQRLDSCHGLSAQVCDCQTSKRPQVYRNVLASLFSKS